MDADRDNTGRDGAHDDDARDDRDAEVAWLLARERGEAAAPPTPETARTYRRLEQALAALPLSSQAPRSAVGSSPSVPLWSDAVLAALSAETPVVPLRRRTAARVVMTVAPALAAAAAVLVLVGRPSSAPPAAESELSQRVVAATTARRSEAAAAVGDELEVRARVGDGELRVYRGDRVLVMRCPGTPACRSDGDGDARRWTVRVPLTAPGRYRAVGFAGAAMGAPTGNLDGDVGAAAQVGARVVTADVVDVQ